MVGLISWLVNSRKSQGGKRWNPQPHTHLKILEGKCEEKKSSLTDNAETLEVNVAIISSCAAIFVFISLSWDCFSLIWLRRSKYANPVTLNVPTTTEAITSWKRKQDGTNTVCKKKSNHKTVINDLYFPPISIALKNGFAYLLFTSFFCPFCQFLVQCV